MTDITDPPQSRIARVATLLERHLEFSVRVGLGGALVGGSLLLLYIGVGITANVLGVLNLPYPFLSMEADPFFLFGGSAIGLFIVQSTGSLLLYQFFAGVEDERSQFVVLLAFISLGFGGALLRVSLLPAIHLLLELL